ATSTRGDYITNIADKLIGKIREKRKVLILVGAHEGLPTGIFRFSDVTIDIAPSVTLSTEYAAISSIIALISVLESRGFFEKFREKSRH
ncbi:MAG TPA: RNA-binding protein, partial [Thermoproteales archaeon]|nr:RNA-binding protein [Thermoproteales archaeon]